jgi:hypothetical protein
MSPYDLGLACAGAFLLAGLLTGVWKYRGIMASADAGAPMYVDIAHRAALMYSFACVVLALLAERSVWPDWLDNLAILLSVLFFGLAVLSYVVHGWLRDTDNQLARPHRLGRRTVPSLAMRGFMGALIGGEIGGLLILLSGFVAGLA